MMRCVILILAIWSGCAFGQVRAEAFGGKCKQDAIGTGIWYVDQFQHSYNLTSNCGFIGMSYLKGNHGFRLGVVDLGSLKVESDFHMRDDEQHLPLTGMIDPQHPFQSPKPCDPQTYAGCIGHGSGEQTARGISLGYLYERPVGKLSAGLEAGGLIYTAQWRVNVTPQAPSRFDPISFNWSSTNVTPYFGATLRYGYAAAMVRRYSRVYVQDGCNGCSGFADGPALQVLIGLSVPL